jgi:hypothetical protein
MKPEFAQALSNCVNFSCKFNMHLFDFRIKRSSYCLFKSKFQKEKDKIRIRGTKGRGEISQREQTRILKGCEENDK